MNPKITSLVFPYHLEGYVSELCPELLYFGDLSLPLPAWPSGRPMRVFSNIFSYIGNSHQLTELFLIVGDYFTACQKEAVEAIKDVSDIQNIQKIFFLSPGTQEVYKQLNQYHKPCLEIAFDSLKNKYDAHSAAVEFMWRTYEYYLESGENISETVKILQNRAVEIGGEMNLLAECVLARHALASHDMDINCLLLSPYADKTLSYIGKKHSRTVEFHKIDQIDQISFSLFRMATENYVPRISTSNSDKINSVLQNNKEELIILKKYTKEKAVILANGNMNKDEWRVYISDFMKESSNHISEILHVKKTIAKEILNKTLTDSTFWATVAPLAGGMTGLLPTTMAALGAAALGVVIASSISATKQVHSRVLNSPYAVIKHLSR